MSGASPSVPFKGGFVRYWTEGAQNAPWLIISHGMGLNSASFAPLAERLQDRWRIVRWDLPGHGQSGPLPVKFNMNVCVEALEAVLNAAGVEKAMLLGFSFGGVVAQLLTQRSPSRVSGLIAYGCLSPLLVKPHPLSTVRVAEAALMQGGWEAAQQRFAVLCSLRDDVRSDVIEATSRLGEPGFRRMLRALLSVRAYDPNFQIAGDLLLIRGEHDANREALALVEAAFRANHPRLKTAIVPNAGHCAHQDNPGAFEQAILAFLNEAEVLRSQAW